MVQLQYNPNPTAIRGWTGVGHVQAAIEEAGLPPPHTLQNHRAGFLRYTNAHVVINYYETTRTVLVQGKEAGRWDEQIRQAQPSTRR